ncbi:hypothetical protein AB0M36_30010, partial [Actinoplanes sp. NPDC051346]|uniref:hypothetical protein n=1 Tax=Actinoplanes sp. NPDC051346 TaxID=3155048 RepID=UPI00342AFFC1
MRSCPPTPGSFRARLRASTPGRTTVARGTLTAGMALLAGLLAAPSPAWAADPVTTPVSLSNDGQPADNAATTPAISADGRYVAFASTAINLVTDD